ncbi:MAG: T9SS type A sorting domain-containing protein [Sphingobacteriaceae bacterium]|nr:T9SS type A sorting domain-containing protein [Sphingobacteriaceae bacterium]
MNDLRTMLACAGRFLASWGMITAWQLLLAVSAQAQCQPIAAGSYTVGTAGANYPSLEAAITALQCAGVQGPVTLQLAPGLYEGRYVLPTLPGQRHLVRITAASPVRFTRPINALQTESFVISGGSWWLENLEWERTLSMLNPGPLLRITGGSGHRLSKNRFKDSSADRRLLNQALWVGQSDSLQLDSNQFQGFSTAVVFAPIGNAKGSTIHANRWENFKGTALQLQAQQQLQVFANAFWNAQGSTTSFAAVKISQVEGLQLFNNRFLGAISPSALHIQGAIANLALENRVYNNEVFGYTDTLNSSAQLQNRIFWLEGDSSTPELLILAHNSIRLRVIGGRQLPQQALLFINGFTSGVDTLGVFNNLFAFDTVGTPALPANFRAVMAQTAPTVGTLLDYNAYGLPLTAQSYFELQQPAATFTTLANWRNNTNWDINSVQADPSFVNAKNSLPSHPSLNNIGFLVPWVLTDITGFFRNQQPDPGVFEFDQVQTDVQLLNVLHPLATVCSFNAKEPLRVVVRNLGIDSLSTLRLGAYLNSQQVMSQRFTLGLGPGQTMLLQFNDSLTFGTAANYQLEIRVDSVLDMRPENDTLRLALRQRQLNQFPFAETFEQLLPGAQQTQLGWSNRSTGNVAWRVQRGPTPTAFTGPATDASGLSTGHYLYFDASLGQPGDTAFFLIECIDLNSLPSPQFSYRLHGYGADLGSLQLEQRVAGQWLPLGAPLVGQQQNSADAAWVTRRSFVQNGADALRFIGVRGNGPRSDWAIDNLQFAPVLGDELVLDSVQVQLDPCSLSGNLSAVFFVRNDGTTILTPRVGIQIGQAPPVFRQVSRVFQPFDSDTVHLQLPFNSSSETLVKFFAANIGDVEFVNDTISLRLQRNGSVSNYPYFEGFENTGAWSHTGQNSSWQRSQPAAFALNSAFSGTSAWVTSPTGLPNTAERSALESPCFDFSNLIKPQLAFAIQYLMGDRMAAQLQYSTNGGSSWQPLGSLFTGENWYNRPVPPGLNRPGAFWSGNSEGWRQCRHDLSFLAGQASVKFRFRFFNDFDTSSFISALEGLAVDAFEIKESPGAFAYQTSLMPATHCSPQPHLVSTRVARAGSLQTIHLRFAVNGGAEVAVPMVVQANGTYTASIPAQAAGALVQWRILTQSDTLLSSPIQSYMDGFLQTALADVSAPQRSQHSFDAGLATTSAFSVGLAGIDSARGVWFKIEAKRKLELSGIELQITRFTGIDAYLLGEEPGTGSVNQQRMRLLGSTRGNTPGGFSPLMFETPMQLNAGQTALLFVQGLHEHDFRVEHLSQATTMEDNNIRVFAGRKGAAPFGFSNQIALPSARLLVRNPADSIRWRNAAGQLLGNANQHQRQMAATPDLVVLQLYNNGCVYNDTALFIPSGTIDLGVVALLQPVLTDVQPGVFYPVKVAIRNFGSLNISNYTMAYRVNGVELSVSPVERLIPAGDTIHYTFSQSWTWVEAGAIVFCAYPENLSLDVLNSNDTLCQARFPTSVSETALGGFKLYPNPAQDYFWLESTKASSNAWLSVYDAHGRCVHQEQLQLEAGERQRVDCSQWANGLYQYRLWQAQEHSSGRILLQR